MKRLNCIDNCQNDILASNPFLEMIENLGGHGDEYNPFIIETTCQQYQMENPFLGIIESATPLNNGESYPPLLPTNPFFKECVNNPFVDSSFNFPTVYEDEVTNTSFTPRESDTYFKEWIEQNRIYYIKTVQSFLCQ
ncbi:hypothetical protein AVEN_178384-1 [Araneus ventricosus]|uniref:Uncharacterized protein n=1 Tax=Araneus ventricosus TaxID=182803 RepID=A0A4Y2BFR2_ARAVE|nr:hypothetical protein AVEN_178384-1 [Araneus ventricosus]